MEAKRSELGIALFLIFVSLYSQKIRTMAKYSGVIFDFNGTLYWDTKLHNIAWDEFLSKHNISLSDEDKFKKMHGKNNKDLFLDFFGQHLSGEQIEQYNIEKELLYQQLCLRTKMELAFGVSEFLDFLKAHNIPFTIATASSKINVDFYFEHLNLSKWFDYEKVIYNNGKIKSKPDPEIYQTAMKIIDKQPSQVLVFEDAIAGLQAAKNAQAGNIIAVNSNNDDYRDWKNYQIITSFDEVDRSLFV